MPKGNQSHQNKLYLDLESYCETPIANGTPRYAEKAEIMLIAYAINDGPAKVWDLTETPYIPVELQTALSLPTWQIVAHNAFFDRTVLETTGFFPKYRLNVPEITRWYCTMSKARSCALPGSLDKLCDIFRLPVDQAKAKTGDKLIHLFCKPLPDNRTLRRATRETHPKEWADFKEYARLDVEAMRVLDGKIPAWNFGKKEQEIWHIDQEINSYGFKVDVELAEAAVLAVKNKKQSLDEDLDRRTGGGTAVSQRDAFLQYMTSMWAVPLPDMRESTLKAALDDEKLPEEVRELIRIRLAASTTSTSKYSALVKSVSSDGRLRGTLVYAGAARTRRFAGRTFQPQNLPRPDMKSEDIDKFIEVLKCSPAVAVAEHPDDLMRCLSNSIRGVVVAPEGKKLVVSDLSNIEGRVLPWLAGEEWKLQAFRDFDAGVGADLYRVAYGAAFGMDAKEVNTEQRQIGKVMELSMGYSGGVGAFVTMAHATGLDLDKMARAALPLMKRRDEETKDTVVEETKKAWEWAKEKELTFKLPMFVYCACDGLKRLWRRRHPEIVGLWSELNEAALDLTDSASGATRKIRKLRMNKEGKWLRLVMPSGNSICYPSPAIIHGNFTYMGNDSVSRQWKRIKSYGGKCAEQATQGFARDILAFSMPRVKKAGYRILLSVHDELVTETPDDPKYNAAELSKLMAGGEEFATGLPLAAKGSEMKRYCKEG